MLEKPGALGEEWQRPHRAAARWQRASSSSFVFSPHLGPFLLPLPSSSLENLMTRNPALHWVQAALLVLSLQVVQQTW